MDINCIEKLESLLEKTPSDQILSSFLKQQVRDWPLANGNFKGLEKVEEKEFEFDGFKMKVQFNPERIRSSAAKVDKRVLKIEPAFFVWIICQQSKAA